MKDRLSKRYWATVVKGRLKMCPEAEATFAGYESHFRMEQKSKHSAAVALSCVALQGGRRN